MVVAVALAVGCSEGREQNAQQDSGGVAGASTSAGTTGDPAGSTDSVPKLDVADDGQSRPCACDTSGRNVVDCNGAVVSACADTEACHPELHRCQGACEVAAATRQSVGCEYYAVVLDQHRPASDVCYAVFVANTSPATARLEVRYEGQELPLSQFAAIPAGFGPGLTWKPYDDEQGLAAGGVVGLFLVGPHPGEGTPSPSFVPCPIATAVRDGVELDGTSGVASAFQITADVPVIAYQFNPYGGGAAAVTGASLLLPTSAWSNNYVLATAYSSATVGQPTVNVVAQAPATRLMIRPSIAVQGEGVVPATPAGGLLELELEAGQHLQLEQAADLTGSILEADAPVGAFAGHVCMNIPTGVGACDHGEQMIPPVSALGHEYVGVMYRPRHGEPAIWRVLGAVDGTVLSWSADVGGPTTLQQGELVEFSTSIPFVVRSQDAEHPFMLLTHMAGASWMSEGAPTGTGDPDAVLSVPTEQYMTRYVFFTDPTYPETNLVVVRKPVDGEFREVELDCRGPLTGWQAVGDYEWTRVDLSTGNFEPVAGCSNGRHEMTSTGPFGLWVWGWGTNATNTGSVSYGYPAGMNVQVINDVVIPTG